MGNPTVRLAVPAPGSGSYDYLLDGSPSGVTETFRVSSDGPTAPWELESVRRAPGGVVLRVQGSGAGALEGTIEIRFESDESELREVGYVFERGMLSVVLDGQRDPVATDREAVLSPLMRVFQGPAIGALLEVGGHGEVVVPALDPTDPVKLLLPTVEVRRAEATSTESDGTRRCNYIGGNYDAAASFWIDPVDRLVRYVFDQGDRRWDVRLAEG